MTKTVNLLLVSNHKSYLKELRDLVEDLDWNLSHISISFDQIAHSIENQLIDVALIDISSKDNLADIQIMNFLKSKCIPLVFLSNFEDQGVYDSIKWTMPAGYLVKPFPKLTFQSTVEAVVNYMDKFNEAKCIIASHEEDRVLENHVFIKGNKNKLTKLFIPDIQAIEAQGNYCIIHTKDKKHVVKTSLKKLKEQLSPKVFLQIHRNFLIQIPHIESIDFGDSNLCIGDKKFPLGATFKFKIQKKILHMK